MREFGKGDEPGFRRLSHARRAGQKGISLAFERQNASHKRSRGESFGLQKRGKTSQATPLNYFQKSIVIERTIVLLYFDEDALSTNRGFSATR